jgi:hypothetical protein
VPRAAGRCSCGVASLICGSATPATRAVLSRWAAPARRVPFLYTITIPRIYSNASCS